MGNLTLAQVKDLLQGNEKGLKNLKNLMDGKLMVYCPAIRKKLLLPAKDAKFASYVVKGGRIAVRAYGSPAKCVTKDGKQSTAGTFIANLPGTSRSKSAARGKSAKRSKSGKSAKRHNKSRKSIKRKSSKRRSSRRK